MGGSLYGRHAGHARTPVLTDSDEHTAIASPGRDDPGMALKTLIRSRQDFPGVADK
jgi:hypothetical protein